jgi:hypothetical protein
VEPDKEKIVKLIEDILSDPKLQSLSREEIALILHQDVILPLFEEMRVHFAQLAFAYSPYDKPSSTN